MSIRLKFKALSNTPVLRNSELQLEVEKYRKQKFLIMDVEAYLKEKMNLENCPIVSLTCLIFSICMSTIPSCRPQTRMFSICSTFALY